MKFLTLHSSFFLCAVLCVLCASALICHAQTNSIAPLPPAPPPFTNYFEVSATRGTNTQTDTNAVASTNCNPVLTWLPPNGLTFTPTNITYAVLRGRTPDKMTATQNAGTAITWQWQPPRYAPPPVTTVHFQSSTDLVHWTDQLVLTDNIAEPARQFRIGILP